MSGLPSQHIDDHSRGLGHALRCGVDCDHRHVGFYEPAETHSSLWRFPKRRQLGGAKISRSTTFYSRTRLGSLPYAVWAGQRVERIAPRCSRFLILFPKRELTRLDLAQHVTRQSLNAAECHQSRLSYVGGPYVDHSTRRLIANDQFIVGEIRNV